MKLISWNVNGLRACVGKNFIEDFKKLDADIFCLQETKLQEGQISLELPGYHQYWNYAEKKATAEQLSLQRRSLSLSPTASASRSMTTKAASSPWNFPHFTSLRSTPPTPRTV